MYKPQRVVLLLAHNPFIFELSPVGATCNSRYNHMPAQILKACTLSRLTTTSCGNEGLKLSKSLLLKYA